MKIENLTNYYTAVTAEFEPIGVDRETSLGFTRIVSNSHGVYGVVATGILHLISDNYSVAQSYLEELPAPRKLTFYDWCCSIHQDVVITTRGDAYYCSSCNAAPCEMVHLERKEG